MGQYLSTGSSPSIDILPADKEYFIAFDFGEIFEICRGSNRLQVEWQVPDFLSLRRETSDVFISPVFNFLESPCYLVIDPFHDTDAGEWSEIFVHCKGLDTPVTYTLGIRRVDGTVDNVNSFSGKTQDGWFPRFEKKFLEKNDLLERQSALLSSNVLTVAFTIERAEASDLEADESEVIRLLSDDSYVEEDPKTNGNKFVSRETQTEDMSIIHQKFIEHNRLEAKSISKLTGHLRDMLFKGEDHDLIIDVQNKSFKAHKFLLCSRSAVLATMFQNDLNEKPSGTVSIEDCDPDTFGEFLKHIYTGKAEIHSTKSAVALYNAGDKYDFQELKETCVQYLRKSLTTTTVCDVIKIATVHGETDLLQKAISLFSGNLQEILKTVEWQHFLQSNVTMANELVIRALKSI